MSHAHNTILPADAPLTLHTLGAASLAFTPPAQPPVQLLDAGKPLGFLTYLALSPARSANRHHLVDVLWADLAPTDAKHALRQTIWYLKQKIGGWIIETDGDHVALAASVSCDRDDFVKAVEGGDLLEAVELYTGEFLPGVAMPGGAAFEQWADLERYRLRLFFVRAAETLVQRWLEEGHARKAQRLARRVRDADELSEAGWRLFLETLLAGSDSIAALSEAEKLRAWLGRDDRVPEPATQRLLRLATAPPDENGNGEEEVATGRLVVSELIGREHEFSAILRAWNEVGREGSGRNLHVSAPAGLGKSRLLADVHARLRASGANVVMLRAYPGERSLAYALASDLAGALANLPGAASVATGVAGSLVALNPALSSHYPVPPARVVGEEALRHRTIAIAEVLNAVCDEQPVAVLIDDVHWADADSRQLLLGVLSRLRDARALVVTTARPVPEGTVGRSEDELRLEPLTLDQVHQLLLNLGELPSAAPWAEELPRRLREASSGSPLLVVESLQLALENGSLDLNENRWSCPDPDLIWTELDGGAALRRRLIQLPEQQKHALLLLAVAGVATGISLLDSASAQDRATLTESLVGLEQRGLAVHFGESWEAAHDEIAAHALDVVTGDAVREAHRSIGLALARDPAAAEQGLSRAGTHLLEAGEMPELARVFRQWLARARRDGTRGRASELARRFLGSQPTDAQLTDLVSQLSFGARTGLTSVAWTVSAGVLVAAAFGAWFVSRPNLPPDAELLVPMPGPADSIFIYSVPIRNEDLVAGNPIDVVRDGRRLPISLTSWNIQGQPAPHPTKDMWAVAKATADSGVIDIFLVDADGTETRVTWAPGDDKEPEWSPDGAQLVFRTARWNAMSWYDIAILDIATGTVRALARSDSTYELPKWSPDGSVIAYRRYMNRQISIDEICWRTVDGVEEECYSDPQGGRIATNGWHDIGVLIATVDFSPDSTVLGLLDITTRQWRSFMTIDGARVSRIAASGAWVAADLRRAGDLPWQLIVLRVDNPLQRVELNGPVIPNASILWKSHQPRKHLDTLQIMPRESTVPLTAPSQFAARSVDPRGQSTFTPVLGWWTSDSSVATIDGSGLLHPVRPGSVTVHVTAGGWRRDSLRVSVATADYQEVFTETWNDLDSARWRLFGYPQPTLLEGQQGIDALWNRGDGSFNTGAYTVQEFEGSQGIGLRILLSTPIAMMQWQQLGVRLTTAVDTAIMNRWDHRTGSTPLLERVTKSCGARYPNTDSPLGRGILDGLVEGSVPPAPAVPEHNADGRWWELTIQVFPDGTCGVAVDRVPVTRSSHRQDVSLPFRIYLDGSSKNTRMLYGPMTVWSGVRSDIDWRVVMDTTGS